MVPNISSVLGKLNLRMTKHVEDKTRERSSCRNLKAIIKRKDIRAEKATGRV